MKDLRSLGRRCVLATAAAIAMITAAAPAGAGAATQLGETFQGGTVPCPNNRTWLQSDSLLASYAAPARGVITSWSFHAGGPAVPDPLRLKVGRLVGADTFAIVGQSAPELPQTNQLNTFSTRIQVEAGDVIGFHAAIAAGGCARSVPGYGAHESPSGAGDPQPGSIQLYAPLPSTQLNLSARLEPDCDADGFGDESQDPDVSSCAPATEKPDRSVSLDANKGKVRKGRRVRLTGQVDAPANEASCEAGQTVELQRKPKSAPDSAFATFESVQTDAAGNFAAKVKVKRTLIYRALLQETQTCDDELSATHKVGVKKRSK
jgi:hypothetical protein